ncbi:uncharacterized protein BHQ10_005960 [Talaromyces amestolkiae]|uniref:Uncharacterized protein n=1 Tax=Talaromyces amestolkiae TaxID=1196081 RepID=A0A364L2B6_TALAM|nr:uncharacterized protein BHQ10_005960 [Talaromyces amestolkiae]RAO69948.1 hypothetical protein BHQ10_005960 [Talaromyces amestolkiae]
MAWPSSAGFTFTSKTYNDTYPTITAANCKQRGRAVFISGASKGIGRSITIAFAQAGASGIAIGARTPLDEVEKDLIAAAQAAGHPAPQVLKLELDVSDEASVEDAANKTKEVFGGLDILVNNAGRLEESARIADSDPKSWWNTWEVNFKGTYLMTRAFVPLLLEGGEKTIVNMTSITAFIQRPGGSAYQTGKLALLRLTEFTATEYEDEGLVAWAIHPGCIATELTSILPPFAKEKLVDEPALVADTIVWLTQEKQAWLNGRYISANWDMEELLSRKQEIVDGGKLKVQLVL